MVTYDNFKEFYLVKDGMPVTEENLNKAPDQLKKEIDELNSSLSSFKTSVNASLNELNSNIETITDFLTALNSREIK